MKCLLCGHPIAHKHGKTTKGIQRYKCPDCGGTFPENLDTLYYNRHLSPNEVHTILQSHAEVQKVKTHEIIADEMWSYIKKTEEL